MVYLFKSRTSLSQDRFSVCLVTTTVKCKHELHVGFEPTFPFYCSNQAELFRLLESGIRTHDP